MDGHLEWMRLGTFYIAACVAAKGFSVETWLWIKSSHDRVCGVPVDEGDSDLEVLPVAFVKQMEEALIIAAEAGLNPQRDVEYSFKWACMNGALEFVQRLCSENNNKLPYSLLSQGLQLAATCGHSGVIEAILSTAKKNSIRLPLDESLFQACDHNRTMIVGQLLHELDSQNVNQTISFNNLLSVSCKNGNLSQVELLLQNHTLHPEKRDLGPITGIINLAIGNGRVEILQRLIEFRPAVLSAIKIGPAIEQNQLAMVKFLLTQPIEFSLKDVATSFHQCCEHGHLQIATLLLIPSPTPTIANLPSLASEDLTESFLIACENNHPDLLELLVVHAFENIDPSAQNNQAIRYASSHGYTQIVNILLDTQSDIVDPSALDNLAIRNACERGHFDIVERLLQDPAVDPGAFDNACLRLACEYGHVKVVKRLLECPEDLVDPRANECYALRAAARNGHWEIVDLLVKDGRSDLTVRDGYVLKQLQNRKD